jgi:hypothetical protein
MGVTHTHSFAFARPLNRRASFRRLVRRGLAAIALAAACGLGTSTAHAGASHHRTPPTEKSELHIFDHIFGGHFTQDGLNFSSSNGVTATRIDAGSASPWSGQIVSAQTEAVFGKHGYGVGYTDSTGTTTPLLNVSGHGYKAGGTGSASPAGDFSLVRTGAGQTLSSNSAANTDGREHLITYSITGQKSDGSGPVKTWLMFWEDKPAHVGWDYNDLVVEMKTRGISAASVAPAPAAIRSQPLLIPLPSAASSGFVGLIGLAIAGKIRGLRRRRLAR